MKKIVTTLLYAFLTVITISDALAQGIPANYIPGIKVANELRYHNNPPGQLTRGTIDTLVIDYDYINAVIIDSSNDSFYTSYIHPINSHYTIQDTFPNLGNLGQGFGYYIVAYNSILNYKTGNTYVNGYIDSIYIDSVYEWLGWQHNSTAADTIVITLVKLDSTGYPTDTVLASDTSVQSHSLSLHNADTSLYRIGFPIAKTFAVQRFGVKVQFFGSTMDTAVFAAGFPNGNTCYENVHTFPQAGLSPFYPNTYLFWEAYSQRGLLPSNSTNNPNTNDDVFYPCNHTGLFNPASDGYNYIQNAWSSVKIAVYYEYTEGINETNPDIKSAYIYPNPVDDNPTLYFTTANATSNLTLNIYDITGNLINSAYLGAFGSGIHEQNINSSDFASGIYVYSISTEKGNAFGKFVKQ